MILTDKISIDELTRPTNLDEHWMRIAILEAYQGQGFTKPNPMVGAVLISDNGEFIAKGYHRYFGGAHAEVDVIQQAIAQGHSLKNTTLYCTLEPCCHTDKKTPPCLPLILQHHFKRVVIGTTDPNPKVRGKSLAALAEAGVEVKMGVLKNACQFLIREFNQEHLQKRPYLHLKMAQSLDGSHGPTVGKNSQARWMTNLAAKNYVHQLRAISDAVLIGGETLRQDSPLLNCRLEYFTKNDSFKQPVKLLLSNKEHLLQDSSFEVFKSIETLLSSNHKRILVEAGPKLMSLFIENNYFDELSIILAPCLLGNIQKLKFMQDYPLEEAIKLSTGKWIPLDDNILFHWVRPQNL